MQNVRLGLRRGMVRFYLTGLVRKNMQSYIQYRENIAIRIPKRDSAPSKRDRRSVPPCAVCPCSARAPARTVGRPSVQVVAHDCDIRALALRLIVYEFVAPRDATNCAPLRDSPRKQRQCILWLVR